MAKKVDPWDFDGPNWIPMKCALCDKCFRHRSTERCIYGGPYKAYVRTEETIGPGPAPESESDSEGLHSEADNGE